MWHVKFTTCIICAYDMQHMNISSEPNFVSTKPKGIPDPPWTFTELNIFLS